MSTVLVISGSMGAGKTAVMGEASDLLLARGIQHAAIDLDMVQAPLLDGQPARDLYLKNITALFDNCRQAGIDRFLVAVAIKDAASLADLKAAANATTITVCRLTASHQTMADRLRMREPGTRQQEFVDRARALDAVLDRTGVADFTIANDAHPITDVAMELLRRAGWL